MNNTGVIGLTAKKKTLSMARNSAYAVNLTYETYRQHISREISIEHPSAGLASLAQLYNNYYVVGMSRMSN